MSSLAKDFTIGFELEYDQCDMDKAIAALSCYGDVKSDCTVDFGFELASDVFNGHQFLSSSIDPKWEKMMMAINDLGGVPESEDGAGQHIHIGRKFFNAKSAFAVNKLFVAYPEFLIEIGEREFTSYCYNELGYFDFDKNEFTSTKYRTVNFGKTDTVEYRLFKSTLKFETFLKNMQFAIAVSAFAIEDKLDGNKCVSTDKGPLRAFTDYVRDNENDYAHLWAYLYANALVPSIVPVKPPYVLKSPANHTDKYFNICDTVRRSCAPQPDGSIGVESFRKISATMVSPMRDMALIDFINSEITAAYKSGSKYVILPNTKPAPRLMATAW